MLKRTLLVIALAPVLFWVGVTGQSIADGDPEALDDLFMYLLATWILYAPVFAMGGTLVMASTRASIHIRSDAWAWTGSVVGASATALSLWLASVLYNLPLNVWPACSIVGAIMGAVLLCRREAGSASL